MSSVRPQGAFPLSGLGRAPRGDLWLGDILRPSPHVTEWLVKSSPTLLLQRGSPWWQRGHPRAARVPWSVIPALVGPRAQQRTPELTNKPVGGLCFPDMTRCRVPGDGEVWGLVAVGDTGTGFPDGEAAAVQGASGLRVSPRELGESGGLTSRAAGNPQGSEGPRGSVLPVPVARGRAGKPGRPGRGRAPPPNCAAWCPHFPRDTAPGWFCFYAKTQSGLQRARI